MWLIDVDTRKLVSFMDDRKVVGKYAILSHTWGDEEVSFADFRTSKPGNMKGYKKIDLTCRQAKEDGLQYAWVDTCCINKDSSAELSEAINSMWRWYQNSEVCYAWLEDTAFGSLTLLHPDKKHKFEPCLEKILRGCRWITRGWTLQELLAPRVVKFYDREWVRLDSIEGFEDRHLRFALEGATGIPRQIIENRRMLEGSSLALRLSWAARRSTSRVEDEAYCLLGLLGINMPLLYGEGEKAFIRLQEEIYRQSTDISILFWHPYTQKQVGMLFAPDVFCFRIVGGETWARQRMSWETNMDGSGDNFITSRGLKTSIPLSEDGTCEGRYCYTTDPTSDRYLRFHELSKKSSTGTSASNPCRELVVVRGHSEVERKGGNLRPMLEADDSILFTDVSIHRDVQHTLIFDLDEGLNIVDREGKYSVDDQLVQHCNSMGLQNVVLQHSGTTSTVSFLVAPHAPLPTWTIHLGGYGMLAVECFDHEYARVGYRNYIPPGTLIICVRKVAARTNIEKIYLKRKEMSRQGKGNEMPPGYRNATEELFGGPPQRALDKITKIAYPEQRPQASLDSRVAKMAHLEIAAGTSLRDSVDVSSTQKPACVEEQTTSDGESVSIQLSLRSEQHDTVDEPEPASHYHSSPKRGRLSRLFGRT